MGSKQPVAAPTVAPTAKPTTTPAVTTTPPNACNVAACNNQMKDYIFNKYWAFENSAAKFTECARCPSRWFKATAANNNHTMTSNYVAATYCAHAPAASGQLDAHCPSLAA